MGRIKAKELLEAAAKDYEKAWLESAALIERHGRRFKPQGRGKPNPIFEMAQRARKTLLDMGFEELLLPTIVDEAEVRKQYGPEANVILDRVFYLAKLPRPEIGLDKGRIEKIRSIAPGFNRIEGIKAILRRYKEGSIEADDLVETMVVELGLREEQASAILDRVFPEFKELKPVPTTLTLRSHTTSLWFPVLAALQDRRSLPLQLFTVGPKFRREERLDRSHLYTSHTASLVVMAEELTLEDGLAISREFLERMGFPEADFRLKRATSKYYAPRTEFEIFVPHPTEGWIEVGDAGMYSPVSLAKYGIEHPVFNVGFGVERLTMVEVGEEDVRRLAYPYFYEEFTMTDQQIARCIRIDEAPRTPEGLELMEALVRSFEGFKDEPSPVEIRAWKGTIGGKEVVVKIWEKDPNVRLLGPAALNEVWVLDGNIIGTLPDEELRRRGVYTGIRYIDALAALIARRAEEAVEGGEARVEIRKRVARLPSDVNLKIERPVRRFITSKRKKIDIRGPVFIGATIEVG